jgi:hypothetical protein
VSFHVVDAEGRGGAQAQSPSALTKAHRMTLRLPAFGAKFRDRRLKGWDPPGIVLVGIDLWLQREWSPGQVLVVPAATPVLLLDFRMLAGCQVAVVTRLREEARARTVVERIAHACDPESLELIVCDSGRIYDVVLPIPTREQLRDAGFPDHQVRAVIAGHYYETDPPGRRYWVTEAQIGARARAAATERAGLAA